MAHTTAGESNMKKQLALLATMAAISSAGQAQDIYAGIGLPGLYTLGIAQLVSANFGLRAEYSAGLSVSKDGNQDGVNVPWSFKANRGGAFADWYPTSGGFRLVGGLTFNDIKAEFNATGSGSSTINGKPVNMAGETYNVLVKFPDTTAYVGLGYGHRHSNTSLVSSGKATQADVDAQNQKIGDSVGGLSALPSASIGLLYRY